MNSPSLLLFVALLPGCGMGWALGALFSERVLVEERFDTADSDEDADVPRDADPQSPASS